MASWYPDDVEAANWSALERRSVDPPEPFEEPRPVEDEAALACWRRGYHRPATSTPTPRCGDCGTALKGGTP